jgi:hypothetical protein
MSAELPGTGRVADGGFVLFGDAWDTRLWVASTLLDRAVRCHQDHAHCGPVRESPGRTA